MSIAGSDDNLTASDIQVPTLLFAGEDDRFSADDAARRDLRGISHSDRFMAIFDGLDHPSSGLSTCQQSLIGTECPNDDVMEVQAILGTSFFDKYLRGNDTYEDVLSQHYAVEHELSFGFFQGAEADVNRDRKTDLEDFLVLADLFGKTKLGRQHRVDFNKDKMVDFTDFLLLAQNYTGGAGATASVPEPSSFHLVLVTLVAAFAICRRRCSGHLRCSGLPASRHR